MGTAIDLGLIYGIMAMGVFLTYRVLNLPDLTVDGSFTTGAGTAAILIVNGVHPVLGTAAGFVAGALAGGATALLHTKFKIDPLLASILVMIALWSVNLRIMGKPNVSLLNLPTLFSPLKPSEIGQTDHTGTWVSILILFAAIFVLKLGVDWFMRTNFGLAVQATGDNQAMASSFGINNNFTKTVTLMLANGLAGLSGAVYAQYQGFADISMGVGMILIGLASVIVGNAIIRGKHIFFATIGVLVGSVIYRLILFFALTASFLSANDMKLISAITVIIALVLSENKQVQRFFRHLSRRVVELAKNPRLLVEAISAKKRKNSQKKGK